MAGKNNAYNFSPEIIEELYNNATDPLKQQGFDVNSLRNMSPDEIRNLPPDIYKHLSPKLKTFLENPESPAPSEPGLQKIRPQQDVEKVHSTPESTPTQTNATQVPPQDTILPDSMLTPDELNIRKRLIKDKQIADKKRELFNQGVPLDEMPAELRVPSLQQELSIGKPSDYKTEEEYKAKQDQLNEMMDTIKKVNPFTPQSNVNTPHKDTPNNRRNRVPVKNLIGVGIGNLLEYYVTDNTISELFENLTKQLQQDKDRILSSDLSGEISSRQNQLVEQKKTKEALETIKLHLNKERIIGDPSKEKLDQRFFNKDLRRLFKIAAEYKMYYPTLNYPDPKNVMDYIKANKIKGTGIVDGSTDVYSSIKSSFPPIVLSDDYFNLLTEQGFDFSKLADFEKVRENEAPSDAAERLISRMPDDTTHSDEKNIKDNEDAHNKIFDSRNTFRPSFETPEQYEKYLQRQKDRKEKELSKNTQNKESAFKYASRNSDDQGAYGFNPIDIQAGPDYSLDLDWLNMPSIGSKTTGYSKSKTQRVINYCLEAKGKTLLQVSFLKKLQQSSASKVKQLSAAIKSAPEDKKQQAIDAYKKELYNLNITVDALEQLTNFAKTCQAKIYALQNQQILQEERAKIINNPNLLYNIQEELSSLHKEYDKLISDYNRAYNTNSRNKGYYNLPKLSEFYTLLSQLSRAMLKQEAIKARMNQPHSSDEHKRYSISLSKITNSINEQIDDINKIAKDSDIDYSIPENYTLPYILSTLESIREIKDSMNETMDIVDSYNAKITAIESLINDAKKSENYAKTQQHELQNKGNLSFDTKKLRDSDHASQPYAKPSEREKATQPTINNFIQSSIDSQNKKLESDRSNAEDTLKTLYKERDDAESSKELNETYLKARKKILTNQLNELLPANIKADSFLVELLDLDNDKVKELQKELKGINYELNRYTRIEGRIEYWRTKLDSIDSIMSLPTSERLSIPEYNIELYTKEDVEKMDPNHVIDELLSKLTEVIAESEKFLENYDIVHQVILHTADNVELALQKDGKLIEEQLKEMYNYYKTYSSATPDYYTNDEFVDQYLQSANTLQSIEKAYSDYNKENSVNTSDDTWYEDFSKYKQRSKNDSNVYPPKTLSGEPQVGSGYVQNPYSTRFQIPNLSIIYGHKDNVGEDPIGKLYFDIQRNLTELAKYIREVSKSCNDTVSKLLEPVSRRFVESDKLTKKRMEKILAGKTPQEAESLLKIWEENKHGTESKPFNIKPWSDVLSALVPPITNVRNRLKHVFEGRTISTPTSPDNNVMYAEVVNRKGKINLEKVTDEYGNQVYYNAAAVSFTTPVPSSGQIENKNTATTGQGTKSEEYATLRKNYEQARAKYEELNDSMSYVIKNIAFDMFKKDALADPQFVNKLVETYNSNIPEKDPLGIHKPLSGNTIQNLLSNNIDVESIDKATLESILSPYLLDAKKDVRNADPELTKQIDQAFIDLKNSQSKLMLYNNNPKNFS